MKTVWVESSFLLEHRMILTFNSEIWETNSSKFLFTVTLAKTSMFWCIWVDVIATNCFCYYSIVWWYCILKIIACIFYHQMAFTNNPMGYVCSIYPFSQFAYHGFVERTWPAMNFSLRSNLQCVGLFSKIIVTGSLLNHLVHNLNNFSKSKNIFISPLYNFPVPYSTFFFRSPAARCRRVLPPQRCKALRSLPLTQY